MDNVQKVVVDESMISGESEPLIVYANIPQQKEAKQ